MKYYAIKLKKGTDPDDAWERLALFGAEVFSSTEEADGSAELLTFFPGSLSELADSFPFIAEAAERQYEGIDWELQWQEHGASYADGHVHMDLASYGAPAGTPLLRLKPGPGFGDLSHPTTRLALRMLVEESPKGKTVIDVGSGSGVLSIAAAALGASHVCAIEIDHEALLHAEANAELNEMQERIRFCRPETFSLPEDDRPLLVVMNMISSEQEAAWNSLQLLHSKPLTLICSGVRAEERENYHALASAQGWREVKEMGEEGWLSFLFHGA